MSRYPSMTITAAGENIATLALKNSKALIFTKAAIGSGDVPADTTIYELTELVELKDYVEIESKEAINEKLKLNITFNNRSAEEAFYAKEIGLYAKTLNDDFSETEEVLYAYTNGGEYSSYIPKKSEALCTEYLSVFISTAAAPSVIVNLSDSLYMTQEDLDAHNTDYGAHASKANLYSPVFDGVPKAPTAEDNSNSTQIANTAFVKKAIENANRDLENYVTKESLQDTVDELKGDTAVSFSGVYTKTETNSLLTDISNKASNDLDEAIDSLNSSINSVNSSIENNYYNKTTVETKISDAIDAINYDNFYTKEQVNQIIENSGAGIKEWTPNTSYKKDSVVIVDKDLYVCKTAHTSGEEFEVTNWTHISGSQGCLWKYDAETDQIVPKTKEEITAEDIGTDEETVNSLVTSLLDGAVNQIEGKSNFWKYDSDNNSITPKAVEELTAEELNTDEDTLETIIRSVMRDGDSNNANNAEYIKSSTFCAGSVETPVYISNGVPKACGDTLSVNILGNASSASKASADSQGDLITNKYATKNELANYSKSEAPTFTGIASFQNLKFTGICEFNSATGGKILINSENNNELNSVTAGCCLINISEDASGLKEVFNGETYAYVQTIEYLNDNQRRQTAFGYENSKNVATRICYDGNWTQWEKIYTSSSNGDITGNAATADAATKDANGNVINDTYAVKENSVLTGTTSAQAIEVNSVTVNTSLNIPGGQIWIA